MSGSDQRLEALPHRQCRRKGSPWGQPVGSEGDQALEALRIRQHVDIGEDVGSRLFRLLPHQFGKLLDCRILVAGLVAGRTWQAIVGDVTLREP